MAESEIIYTKSGEYRYSETFNHQINPNLKEKHNEWENLINAAGQEGKLWAKSSYTRKKVTKTVNGKKVPISVDYISPWTCTAHDFRLNIPSQAHVKKVTVEVRMKCSAGLKVKAPSAWFMVYGGNGTVSQQTKTGKTGWYNNLYRVFLDKNLSSTATTYRYEFPESQWNKMNYPSKQLNKTVMGVDLVFPEPTSMSKDTHDIAINWVRIKVDYVLEDTYLKCSTEFREESNPYTVDVGKTFKLNYEFGNRTCVDAGYKEVPIQLPKGVSLVSYDIVGSASEFYPVSPSGGAMGEYIWKCQCGCNAKTTLRMRLRADTIGSKIATGTLDGIPYNAYAYVNGRSEDMGTEYITSGDIQKGQISCFQFVTSAYSLDGTITYDVKVDGENQSNPANLSEVFRETYHNSNGQGNNLVAWTLDEDSAVQGVSIDEDLTNNNHITFNIPEDTTVQIAWTGCFIPVTVGQNTLYLTNNDTGNVKSYQYTSYDAKTTVMNIQPVEETWYDHWITTQMETGAFILPFVTKATDRVMVVDECSMKMTLEKPVAYVGCVKLPRSHYEPTSDFDNDIIKKQYKNKKYVGKSGEISEKIDFKAKLPPRDWTTFQGLCELDKPVPVNAVPTAFEGDVLNHRGWVELGAVKDVKKTNPLYYDGKLEFEYLTHNINTKFQIIRGAKVSKYNSTILGSLLDYVIESGDEFADYYHIDSETGTPVYNETGYFTVDTDGTYIYDDDEGTEDNKRTLITMDNNQYIRMKSVNALKETTRINFEWFSSKIEEDRENNITRIVRIRDKSNDIILEYQYYDYEFDYDDELYNCSVKCTKLDKSINQMVTVIEEDDLNFAVDLEALNLVVDEFGNIVQEVEPEDEEESEETDPTYIDPVTGEVVEIVQDAEVYNDYMYGSTLTLELAGNILSINDSGFNGREVHEEGIELEKGEYYLEVEFMNNNIDSDTPDVYHFFDFEIEEPILLTDYDKQYANTIVSAYPLPDKIFSFLRKSEEGMLYYYHYDGSPYTYIQEPYYMYARGVDLVADDGQSIFNLNNSYTTFYVQNGLVRIGFNRLTGAIYLAKFDLMLWDYITVASFYIKNHTDFKIGKYSDDKIEVKISKTVFTVYRGHPYVVVKHNNDHLYFTTSWNKVFADSVNGVEEAYPVLWDLMNHENLLVDCVGGINLKASCLTTSSVDNDDIGSFPTLSLSKVTPNPIYTSDTVFFSVDGSVTDVDEEIPIETTWNGSFGEYESHVEVDEDVPFEILVQAKSVIQSGEVSAPVAKVASYDHKGIPGQKVYFYEEFEPRLLVKSDKTIIQTGDVAKLSARMVDSEDGSIIAEEGVRVDFYMVGAGIALVTSNETVDVEGESALEYATLTATLYDDEGYPVSGVYLGLFKDGTLVKSDVTDGSGSIFYTYLAENAGDVSFVCNGNDYTSNTVVIHDYGYVSITARALFDDRQDMYGNRPDTLVATLKVGNESIMTANLSSSNNYTYVFEDLPAYAQSLINYTVDFEDVSLYSKSVVKTGNVFTSTYSESDEIVTKSVGIIWDDDDDSEGLRPLSVGVSLNGHEHYRLTDTMDYFATFNLPKYVDGVIVDYTAYLDLVPNYRVLKREEDGDITMFTLQKFTPRV